MIPNSKIENVDYELIPSEDKLDGWNDIEVIRSKHLLSISSGNNNKKL